MEFVDLKGASGATYRFRRQAEGAQHPPIAGNFVILHMTPRGPEVLQVGVTDDLSRHPTPNAPDGSGQRPQMFVRLNIARTMRMAEHADLSAGYGGAEIITPEV